MIQLSTAIAFAALALAAVAPSQDARFTTEMGAQVPAQIEGRQISIGAPTDPAHVPWVLSWDDSLDSTLDRVGKNCRVTLDTIDSVVVGRFDGPVMGGERRATFTGELVQGGALLLLQQREPGYVCSYQLSSSGPGWVGTWRDSRGRSGTAKLARSPLDFDV